MIRKFVICNYLRTGLGAPALMGLFALGCSDGADPAAGAGGGNGPGQAGTPSNSTGGGPSGSGGAATAGAKSSGAGTAGSPGTQGGRTGTAGSTGAGGSTAGAGSGGVPVTPPGGRTKPRVIVTTDGEIDDTSSMIRFLQYASDYDVAGIIQVNGVQESGHSKDKWIEKELVEYEKCLPNLRKHRPDFPDTAYLTSVTKIGNENSGDRGKTPPNHSVKDTEGSEHIIKVLLDDDPRPVHVLAWGGTGTQGYALHKLKTKHTPEEFKRAVEKIRLYCIWYQDATGKWIETNIPEAKIYEAGSPNKDGGWRTVWDYFNVPGYYKPERKMPSGIPVETQQYMNKAWLAENVKTNHGALGAAYTQPWTSEGDSPSFMPLVDNGLEQHEDYTLGGWGGRPIYKSGNHMQDGSDERDGNPSTHHAFGRWIPALQNDWAARNDWCVADVGAANHQPNAQVAGGLVREVTGGAMENLDASPTTDPDGNELTFKWWQYHEADSASAKVTITNPDAKTGASFMVPSEPGKHVHVILEVTDKGTPPLTRYQRIIFKIK